MNKIQEFKEIHHATNEIYINARTDTYFETQNPLLETIARGRAYVDSGIFVPGLKNDEEIKEIVTTISAPLNVLSLPGLTNCNKLKELGVKRFSFGNALSDKVIACIKTNASQLLESMDTSHFYEN